MPSGPTVRVRIGVLLACIAGGLPALGCFSEQSIRMRGTDRIARSDADVAIEPSMTVRDWLVSAHAEMASLLPALSALPLLSEDMAGPDGVPTDVYAHFGIKPDKLDTILCNLPGLQYTAQAASKQFYIEEEPEPWPGFETVWIRINDTLSLCGRLGMAMDGDQPRDADCIVILPGFFGDNGVHRTRDLAAALHKAGFHVLGLELRGCGRTEYRYPRVGSTFGVLESDDLMHVADWLQARPHIKRTGLVGYCWGANIALLAGWYEARTESSDGFTPAMNQFVDPPTPEKRRFEAGVLAFSPVMRWEVLRDKLDVEHEMLDAPILNGIQNMIRDRIELKHYPRVSGSLRQLIEYEYLSYDDPLPGGVDEGFAATRLLPYREHPDGDKLEAARMPILIVHGANDPLTPSQDVADFMARTQNPNVAAMILPNGGHTGFAIWARAYYFNLILDFFDPSHGAATVARDPDPAWRRSDQSADSARPTR